jgi:hypothetical protein
VIAAQATGTDLAGWISRVDQVTDPLARELLDLHSRDDNGYCRGDEFDGVSPEPPNWPCATVELVMAHLGDPAPPNASDNAWQWPSTSRGRPRRR